MQKNIANQSSTMKRDTGKHCLFKTFSYSIIIFNLIFILHICLFNIGGIQAVHRIHLTMYFTFPPKLVVLSQTYSFSATCIPNDCCLLFVTFLCSFYLLVSLLSSMISTWSSDDSPVCSWLLCHPSATILKHYPTLIHLATNYVLYIHTDTERSCKLHKENSDCLAQDSKSCSEVTWPTTKPP